MATIPAPPEADGVDVGATDGQTASNFHDGPFFDITEYGASTGASDNSGAIEDAMQEAANNNGAAVIPEGTFQVGGSAGVDITSSFDGAALIGDAGTDSVIQPTGGRGISFFDSSHANVSLANFRVDASNATLGISSPQDKSGVNTGQNLQFENLWVHGANSSGIHFSLTGGGTASPDTPILNMHRISVWDTHRWHGIGLNNAGGYVTMSGILAWNNGTGDTSTGGHGVDPSGSHAVLTNFLLVDNMYGTKSTGENVNTEYRNGAIIGSQRTGYHTSGDVPGSVVFDNVLARECSAEGFSLGTESAKIGTIWAINNCQSGGDAGIEFAYGIDVDAEEVQVCGTGSGNPGIAEPGGAASGTVARLVASGNDGGNFAGTRGISYSQVDNAACGAPTLTNLIDTGSAGGGNIGSGRGGTGTSGGAGVTQFETRRVGLDDIPDNLEPPAAEVTVDAWMDAETWQALNAMRDRDDPFDLAIGDFTLSDVGITDLTANVAGDTSGYDVSITVKEHRITYVQAANISDSEEESDETSDDTPADRYIRNPDNFGEIPGADTDTTVNLGDEGLSDGDVIDPYLEDHLASGTRVEIPAGDYTWNGGGMSGTYQNAAVVGVAGESDDGGDTTNTQAAATNVLTDGGPVRVYLDASSAATDGPGADITVPGGGAGSFHMASITFTGQQQNHPLIRIRATSSGTSILLRRIFMPDGGGAGSAPGIVIPGAHSGSAYIRNCYVRGFPNCGVLAGDASGPVRVEGGLYRNNNVADLELGSDDTRAELVTIVNDNPAPQFNGQSRTQRGIWFSEAGTGMQVVDCDFYHDVDSGSAIVAASGPAMTGTVRDSRITNNSSRPAAIINNDISFENVHLTGSGELTIRGAQAACAGDSCNRANWSTDEEQQTVNMDERVLDAGEVRQLNLGDNDVLDGVVFDQSANGARVELNADGSDWTIQNVAIVGKASGQNQHATITAAAPSGSSGDIRNVYLADGAHSGSGLTGIRALAHHGGELRVQNCNVQQYPNIGVHGHRPAANDGAGGTVVIDGCYLAHNGGANATLGAPGSDLVNSVVYSDGSGPNDTGAWRGVWGWYAATTVTNSDVYTGPSAGAAIATNHGGSVTMTNGDIHGGTEGDVSLVNVGQSPSSSVPGDVPDSPVQAAGTDSE